MAAPPTPPEPKVEEAEKPRVSMEVEENHEPNGNPSPRSDQSVVGPYAGDGAEWKDGNSSSSVSESLLGSPPSSNCAWGRCSASPHDETSAPTSDNSPSPQHEHNSEGQNYDSTKNYTFDQEASRKELCKMIVLHGYPLSIVHHDGFRSYSRSLQPLFKIPSRDTIRSDILMMHMGKMVEVCSELEVVERRIAITINTWMTSDHLKHYMEVTAHYIDNSWNLQKRIIGFLYVPYPLKPKVAAKILMRCFRNWNIAQNLSTVTVDNYGVNDDIVQSLHAQLFGSLIPGGEFFHVQCCASMLHLVVKDGLDVFSNAIEKVHNVVVYWSAVPKRRELFEDCARQLKIQTKEKLHIDVKTRWNSTYLMLKSALPYKDVFYRAIKRKFRWENVPKREEWDMTWGMAKEIYERLKVFYSVHELFLGKKCATANLYCPKLYEIRLALLQWCSSPNRNVVQMAARMWSKFEKYWTSVSCIIGVATVLDPRYKTCLLEYYYEQMHPESCADEIAKIVRVCHQLFEKYKRPLPCIPTSMSGGIKLDNDSMLGYDSYAQRKKKQKVHPSSELDHYLEDALFPRTPNFDILDWWKIYGPKYPTLQKIAGDIYAIPFSTVTSESTFGTVDRKLSSRCNSLKEDLVEALMTTQSWLSAEIQGPSGMVTIDDEVDDGEANWPAANNKNITS